MILVLYILETTRVLEYLVQLYSSRLPNSSCMAIRFHCFDVSAYSTSQDARSMLLSYCSSVCQYDEREDVSTVTWALTSKEWNLIGPERASCIMHRRRLRVCLEGPAQARFGTACPLGFSKMLEVSKFRGAHNQINLGWIFPWFEWCRFGKKEIEVSNVDVGPCNTVLIYKYSCSCSISSVSSSCDKKAQVSSGARDPGYM